MNVSTPLLAVSVLASCVSVASVNVVLAAEKSKAGVHSANAVEVKSTETVSQQADGSGACPETKITFSSRSSAYKKDVDLNKIVYTIATRTPHSSKDVSKVAFNIALSNFPVKGTQYSELFTPQFGQGQGLIEIALEDKSKDARGPVFMPGRYNVAVVVGTEDRTGALYFKGANDMFFRLWTERTEGSLEITSVTNAEICGKINLKDPNTEVAGVFRAPIK